MADPEKDHPRIRYTPEVEVTLGYNTLTRYDGPDSPLVTPNQRRWLDEMASDG